ncbi:MAG: helix-turn-helix domain-containing protein [Polyangiaceae bacterium]|nr:helix-turn-helix domain-containing protein [Polyangiaceae bacterium]
MPTRRSLTVTRAASRAPQAPRRAASLEEEVVELCGGGARARIGEAAARIRSGLDRVDRRLDLARLVRLAESARDEPTRRRIGYLLERAGEGVSARALLPARARWARLDPAGAPWGVRLARWRLIINACDGFEDPEAKIAGPLGQCLRDELGGQLGRVAIVLASGVALETALLARLGGPRGSSLVPLLESRGLVRRERGALVPVPPFTAACVWLSAREPASRRTRLLSTLAVALLEVGDGDALAAAVEAFGSAGDAGRARATALAHHRTIAATASPRRIASVIGALGSGALEAPARQHLFERLGRYDEAADEARERHTKASAGARLALAVERARLAWRRGRAHEARQLLDEVEASRQAPASARIEAALLRATLAIESASYARAEVALRAATALSETEGTEADRARCLHRIGTMEARRGRVDDARAAYRAALEIATRAGAVTPALAATLRVNLANMALWSGRWEEAADLAEAAIAVRRVAGSEAEVVSAQVLRARVDRARDAAPPPGGRFAALAAAAERTRDARLVVEAFVDLAEEHALAQRQVDAVEAVDRARLALVQLAGAEPLLTALVDAVAGQVAALGPDPMPALDRLSRAARRLGELEAPFFAARAGRAAAAAALAVGRLELAAEELELAAEASARFGFALGQERAYAPLHAFGALEGGPLGKQHSERALAALGPAAVSEALLTSGRGDLLRRLGARSAPARTPAGVARLTAPDGTRGIDAAETARWRAGVPGAVVFDAARDELVLPWGARRSLRDRRVLAPLVRELGAAGAAGRTVSELIERVLERRDSPSARRALKVSISRLRALLGAAGEALTATRVRGRPAYRLGPSLAWVVLEEP